MKGIKRYGRIYLDDHLKSKAIDIERCNVSMPIFKEAASFMLKSTPLWPISEKIEGINHSKRIKNVCNTLPSFIHKNSRQGEEWPAKGSISGFDALDRTWKPMSIDDRMLVFESIGGRQTTVISLPRCRMMVDSQNPERPHFFSWGCEDHRRRVSEEESAMVHELLKKQIQIGFG